MQSNLKSGCALHSDKMKCSIVHSFFAMSVDIEDIRIDSDDRDTHIAPTVHIVRATEIARYC